MFLEENIGGSATLGALKRYEIARKFPRKLKLKLKASIIYGRQMLEPLSLDEFQILIKRAFFKILGNWFQPMTRK